MVMIDVEMPETCYGCVFSVVHDDKLLCELCKAIKVDYADVNSCIKQRYEKCPLIQPVDFCPIMEDDCK